MCLAFQSGRLCAWALVFLYPGNVGPGGGRQGNRGGNHKGFRGGWRGKGRGNICKDKRGRNKSGKQWELVKYREIKNYKLSIDSKRLTPQEVLDINTTNKVTTKLLKGHLERLQTWSGAKNRD